MNDGGVIILIIAGLITSLIFISLYIIEPYLKNKKGTEAKYNKIKIFFSLIYFTFFIVLLILDFFGFFKLQ